MPARKKILNRAGIAAYPEDAGISAIQGMVFDGTAPTPNPWPAFGLGDWSIEWDAKHASTAVMGVLSFGLDQGVFSDALGTVVTWGYSAASRALWSCDASGHFVITKSGDTLELYRNGESQGTRTLANASVGAGSYIGAYNAGVPAALFSGTIRLVRPFNYTMTADQVAALFRDGAPAAVDRGGGKEPVTAWSNINMPTFASTGPDNVSTETAGLNYAETNRFSTRKGECFRLQYECVATGAGTTQVSSEGSFATFNLVTGSVDEIITSQENRDNERFILGSNGAGTSTVSISNFSLVSLGTLAQYDLAQLGTGPQFRDVNGTANPAHINLPGDGSTGGVVWARPSGQPSRWSATLTGSGYLLGRDGRHITANGRIREIRATGNGTFSLGSSAGAPSDVVNAQTASATQLAVVALAGDKPSTGKLYGTLGTATAVELEILSD